jgi:uncharacterized protein YndB with AHSA1/START domain
VVVVGYLLPVEHHASRERTYAASPSTVFAAISTPADLPRWRSGVKSVELLPDDGERPRFREVGSDGAITYVIDELVPERRMVTRIADKSLPFGGSWTYELMPAANGTTLRITEKGEVYNPIFRVMSRFVLGHHRTIDNYMADLDRHLAAHSARAQ